MLELPAHIIIKQPVDMKLNDAFALAKHLSSAQNEMLTLPFWPVKRSHAHGDLATPVRTDDIKVPDAAVRKVKPANARRKMQVHTEDSDDDKFVGQYEQSAGIQHESSDDEEEEVDTALDTDIGEVAPRAPADISAILPPSTTTTTATVAPLSAAALSAQTTFAPTTSKTDTPAITVNPTPAVAGVTAIPVASVTAVAPAHPEPAVHSAVVAPPAPVVAGIPITAPAVAAVASAEDLLSPAPPARRRSGRPRKNPLPAAVPAVPAVAAVNPADPLVPVDPSTSADLSVPVNPPVPAAPADTT